MRLSKLSKTRLAAMSISANANIRLVNELSQFAKYEEAVSDGALEKSELGELIWNELCTIGLKERTMNKIARCFELVANTKIVPIQFTKIEIGFTVFDHLGKFAYAAVIPTKNSNGHNYDLGRVCVLNRASERSGLLKANGRLGNSISTGHIALPNPEALFDFFDTNRYSVPLNRINEHYEKEEIKRAASDVSQCVKTISEYESVINRILALNNKIGQEIIKVR